MRTPDPAIQIEVVYALPERQVMLQLSLSPGTTAEQAVEFSEISRQFPEIDLSRNKLGIFGKLAGPDRVLRDGDRVEIYRPLALDPKDTRRKRAKLQSGVKTAESVRVPAYEVPEQMPE